MNDNGFSLIELLVVILIVTILAAISAPYYFDQRSRARQAEVMSAGHNLMVTLVANSTRYKGVYPQFIAYGNPEDSDMSTVFFTRQEPFNADNLAAWYKPEPGRTGYNFCLESKHVPGQHVEYTHATGSLSPWINTQGCDAALNVSGPGWVKLQ